MRGIHYLVISLFTILFAALIVVVSFPGPGYGSQNPATTAAHTSVMKARVPDITTVIYATVTSTTTSALTQMPTHTSVAVQNGLNAGAIVGICFAVVCGILLTFVILACVARCLAGRLERLIAVGDRPAGNCCNERHSTEAVSTADKIGGGYSLQNLAGEGITGGDLAAKDPSAAVPPGANHSAGDHASGDRFAGN